MNLSTFSIADFCQAIALPAQKTLVSWFWTIITNLWSWYGLAFFAILAGWVIWEIYTRHGTAHYNSENGFSPTFNRVVGGGTYLLLQTVTYLILRVLFGGGVYCLPYPYVLHILVFVSTGKLLNLIGFWPRLEQPNQRKRWKRRY